MKNTESRGKEKGEKKIKDKREGDIGERRKEKREREKKNTNQSVEFHYVAA